MAVRKYEPTGIEVSRKEDPTTYNREYYRRVRRFKKKEAQKDE